MFASISLMPHVMQGMETGLRVKLFQLTWLNTDTHSLASFYSWLGLHSGVKWSYYHGTAACDMQEVR